MGESVKAVENQRIIDAVRNNPNVQKDIVKQEDTVIEKEVGFKASLQCSQSGFSERNLPKLLALIYKHVPFKKIEVAARAGICVTHLHQIFSGMRHPTREKLICVCIGMELKPEEVQQVLEEAEYAGLSERSKREAIILYGLSQHRTLSEIDYVLEKEGEKKLN